MKLISVLQNLRWHAFDQNFIEMSFSTKDVILVNWGPIIHKRLNCKKMWNCFKLHFYDNSITLSKDAYEVSFMNLNMATRLYDYSTLTSAYQCIGLNKLCYIDLTVFGTVSVFEQVLKIRSVLEKLEVVKMIIRQKVASIRLANHYQHLDFKFQISSRSVNKHGCHRQFLFQVGRFLKIFFSETA
jgi:hypothetical protein